MSEVPSWDDIFGGELSEPDSIASVKPPATVSSIHEHEISRNQKRNGRDSRPTRNTVKQSYAESDTSDDMVTHNSVVGSKRKRNGTPPGQSPKKRVKARGRRLSASALQSLNLPQMEHTTASRIKKTSSQTLLTLSPSTPSRAFIRLDPSGEPPRLSIHDGYWWPAQRVESEGGHEITYRLYGDDGNGSSRLITLHHHSFPYLQPFWIKPPTPRYTDANFQSGEAIDKIKFKDAVRQLIRDEDDEDEDVESQEEDMNASQPAETDEETEAVPDWRPPSPSQFLEYVGQAVLCKSRLDAKEYWPAKVVEYIHPTRPSSKPRFRIDFFDWRTGELTRDCFFTQYDKDESGFAECKLDARKLSAWIEKNSHTAEEEDEPLNVDLASLPPPHDPPPKARVFLYEMGIEEQFAYVMPFLPKILNESYAPSQDRINRWMDPKTRQIVTNNPVQGGHLAEVEWNVFTRLVHQWVLPKRTHVDEQTEVAPDRPQGSERYENLQFNDKTLFVIDVLVGEAVIQLLLFRAGKRAQLDVLSDEEEQALYKVGERLSNEESTSILVRTVLEARARIREKRGLKVENPTTTEESTSRLRRNGNSDKPHP